VSRNWTNGGGLAVNATNLNAMETDIANALAGNGVKWQPNTAYTAGQQVISPNGDLVKAFESHTSGTTYTPANWYADMGYLFANFTYNSLDAEKLNLFGSPDGVTVLGHGPNPVYSPSTGLRDPSLKNINGTWFLAYGFDDPTQKKFAVAKSPDLITWTLVVTIDVSTATGITQAWAPELTLDTNGDVYIFFTNVLASTMEMWYVKATDATGLTTWGAPAKLSWVSQPTKAMDAVFQKVGSTWYMFYGDNNYVCRATASSLLGPWTTDKTGDWAGWGINREAPQLVRVSSTKWRLYIDRYAGTSPNWTYPGYAYTESSDLTNWGALTPLTMGADNGQGIVLRHGSFIKLNDSVQAAQVRNVLAAGAGFHSILECTASTSLTSGSETQVGTLTTDTASSFNYGDYSFPAAGQVKVGSTGIYTLSFHAGPTANNFANGTTNQWVSIYSPTKGRNVARNVGAGGYEMTASVTVRANAGEVFEFRLAQFSGATKTVDSRVTVTRIA
jgi:hypothetical protein